MSKTNKPTKPTEFKDERWKKFPKRKLKDKYQVSDYGRVMNISTQNILKPGMRANYHSYGFSIGEQKKAYKIHRIVAKAFVKNEKPEEYDVVNHLDGCKLNNYYKNLEWGDTSKNNKHAFDTGLVKSFARRVGQYLNGKFIKEYPTVSAAAAEMECDTSRISETCRGRRKDFGGYQWKYLDKDTQNVTIDNPAKEGYRKIDGFKNYWINAEGNIYSTHSKKLMRYQPTSEDRLSIQLSVEGKTKTFLVHRLVAQYFVEKFDDNDNSVGHHDKNYTNNRADNLYWLFVPGVEPIESKFIEPVDKVKKSVRSIGSKIASRIGSVKADKTSHKKTSNTKADKTTKSTGKKTSNIKADKTTKSTDKKPSNTKADKTIDKKTTKSTDKKTSNIKADKTSDKKTTKSTDKKTSNIKADKTSDKKTSNIKADKTSDKKTNRNSGSKISNVKVSKCTDKKTSNIKADKTSNKKTTKSTNNKRNSPDIDDSDIDVIDIDDSESSEQLIKNKRNTKGKSATTKNKRTNDSDDSDSESSDHFIKSKHNTKNKSVPIKNKRTNNNKRTIDA